MVFQRPVVREILFCKLCPANARSELGSLDKCAKQYIVCVWFYGLIGTWYIDEERHIGVERNEESTVCCQAGNGSCVHHEKRYAYPYEGSRRLWQGNSPHPTPKLIANGLRFSGFSSVRWVNLNKVRWEWTTGYMNSCYIPGWHKLNINLSCE